MRVQFCAMVPVIEDLPEPVTVTRLPVGHPHTPADQVFQDPNMLVSYIDGWHSCSTVTPSYASTTLSRLPVGHTYTQVDQRFRAPSQHSHGEGAVDAPTPNEFMHQELKESNSKAKADQALQ